MFPILKAETILASASCATTHLAGPFVRQTSSSPSIPVRKSTAADDDVTLAIPSSPPPAFFDDSMQLSCDFPPPPLPPTPPAATPTMMPYAERNNDVVLRGSFFMR